MKMISRQADISELWSDSAREQISLTKEVFEGGETWSMAVPYRFYFKSALRLHLCFLPLFVCLFFNPLWLAFTLPLYPAVIFLYARLIRHMKSFSLRSARLWLTFGIGNAVTAAAAWGIVWILKILLSGAGYIRM